MPYCMQCAAALTTRTEEGCTRSVCPACGWIHYNNPRPCVTAVILKSEYVLLTLRNREPGRGKWDLPGGFMERGEHPADAMKREVREELSVPLTDLKLFGMYPNLYDGTRNVHTLDLAYLCRIDADPAPQTDEFLEWDWFHLGDMPDNWAFASIEDILHDVRNLFGFV